MPNAPCLGLEWAVDETATEASGWLLDLALALVVEPDLRFEDAALVHLIAKFAPCAYARVWTPRGDAVAVASESPGAPPSSSLVGEAARELLNGARQTSTAGEGIMLFPLATVAVLEIEASAFTGADLLGLEKACQCVAQRIQSSNLLEAIVEHLPDMVFVKDAEELRFVHFNRAGERLIGLSRDELIGRNDYDLFPREEADSFTRNDRAVLHAREPLDIPEESIQTQRGSRTLHTKKIPISGADGSPRYLLGISRDITERRLIDGKLHQSQKLEVIAQLTAGLAHNFNNAAMVISGYAALAQRSLPEGSGPAAVHLEKLGRASSRVSDLASKLLVFAQNRVIDPVTLNLSQLLDETADMLEPLLGEKIVTERGGIERDCYATADRAQLEQVIVNIAINAKDAMPDGGTLSMSLTKTTKGLRLRMADTGVGMSSEVGARALEPFFTTKPSGVGSGLGLFSANEIVRQHGGAITIHSRVGEGTAVEIELPRANKPLVRLKNEPEESRTGFETILVVEDDDDVRAVLTESLAAASYDVLSAPGGLEALDLLADLEDEPIDLLLSDVVMPNMGGPELVRRVRELRPETKVILVSGYTDQGEQLSRDPALTFLAKPIETERLLRVVRSLFDK